MRLSDSNSFDLPLYLKNKRKIINDALTAIIDGTYQDNRLCDAMEYSLMASGKRLRPVLCLSTAELFGNIGKSILSAACAIEMVHTYSLIHDDLPAMDDDQLRRGQPTCHIQFDEATAILAGDALLTMAFEVLTNTGNDLNDPQRLLQAVNILSNAAGYRGMIEGQMLDIMNEGKELDIEALKQMHFLKTGALIEASVHIGALLSGATSEQIQHLLSYARNIGLAFQVADDILNVEGDETTMGKATGTDFKNSKSTFPVLIGLDTAKQYARELINNALQALSFFGNKSLPLSALASYIIERKR